MILHVDLSTGASGDKLMGALLEVCESLGLAGFDDIQAVAQSLVPNVEITRTQVLKSGISATHLTVAEHPHHYGSEHECSAADSQTHEHTNADAHQQAQIHHRNWADIKKLIAQTAEQGVISANAAAKANQAFEYVALAEAAVHGVEPEQLHFHEVGAADSIIDIVCSSFLFDKIQPAAVYATPMALGNGTVVCAHGELPVPAPATARIIADAGNVGQGDEAGGLPIRPRTCCGAYSTHSRPRNKCGDEWVGHQPRPLLSLPVYASTHQGELTTPTGAALIRAFVTQFAPLPCCEPQAIGYGGGSKEIPGAANLLRILAAEPADFAGLTANPNNSVTVEGVALLETNIDHRTPEALSYICDDLINNGALDVWQEPITMKKGRLAIKLNVLCQPGDAQKLSKQVIEQTGSLGVRSSYLERTVIPRKTVMIDTAYGPVPFKSAEFGAPGNRKTWIRPEHDAVAALAKQHNLDYQILYDELLGTI